MLSILKSGPFRIEREYDVYRENRCIIHSQAAANRDISLEAKPNISVQIDGFGSGALAAAPVPGTVFILFSGPEGTAFIAGSNLAT